MGSFICKQPNGLYCRYSSIVDNITHYNMTKEEYIQYRKAIAEEEAIETLDKVEKGRYPSFDEMLEMCTPDNKAEFEFAVKSRREHVEGMEKNLKGEEDGV